MQPTKNIPYFLTAVGIFILLKFGFTIADTNTLTFLLKPTDKFVGLLTGSQSVYLSYKGYYHEKLNIVIEKSCSGFNFWVLGFLVFTYLGLKYVDKHRHKSKIMTPVTSYLVVENEAQKAMLKKKQEQALSGNKSLDLGEDTQRMSEPGLWILIILFGIILCCKQIRKKQKFDSGIK